ncbi:hypothetical protein PoB_005950400 [Plakobranchus ocellatus]|uniref:Uncharacterized protein n=1 Tax=Plakobranchus ocellatus TaxID=259542 RepID=A0AAV4CNA7_9GAST|nr:hypothetical protein PoB_005950400 [Plakobranchus ocellatus]
MAAPFPLSDRASDVRPGCKTKKDSSDAPTSCRHDVRSYQRKRVFQNTYCWTRELLPPVCAYAKERLNEARSVLIASVPLLSFEEEKCGCVTSMYR